jgi:hypothetical protein
MQKAQATKEKNDKSDYIKGNFCSSKKKKKIKGMKRQAIEKQIFN